MNEMAREWVEKAEGDFATMQRELRARKNPNYDAACFHAQQCAEKYLKACLQQEGIPFGKTHDLAVLLDGLLPIEPTWELYRDDLRVLSSFAIEIRYPGESADREAAMRAARFCMSIRKAARQRLGPGL
jgi:HEPN domain-containing protein